MCDKSTLRARCIAWAPLLSQKKQCLRLWQISRTVVMKGWVTSSDRAVVVRARKQDNRGSKAHQPPAGAKAELARAARIERDEDLLMATARLSLCTARQLRTLTGILLRTVTIPDGRNTARGTCKTRKTLA